MQGQGLRQLKLPLQLHFAVLLRRLSWVSNPLLHRELSGHGCSLQQFWARITHSSGFRA